MVLRLQYLKYHTSGGLLTPYFLRQPDDEEIPKRLIEHLEALIGTSRQDVDLDTPITWVPDTRVARALISTALSRFYIFEPQKLENLVTSKELTELRRQGIDSLEELRLWYWSIIQKQYGGFIPREKRSAFLDQIEKTLHLKSDKANYLLIAHRDEHMLLKRHGSCPTAEELLRAYNFEVLETLLYNSESVTFLVTGESLGSAARVLFRFTKRFGVIIDLEQTNEGLRTTITGPRIFFGRASSFGWNIAQVLTNLLQETLRLGIQLVDLKIDVVLRDRNYVVHLKPDKFPPLLPRGEVREEAFLDSKVEKQFYWSWKNNKFRGWDIIREPDAITIGSSMIIPDFALVKGDKKVLLEIIGYWREEYTQKKNAQLEILRNLGLEDFILLIDKKNRKYFSKSVYPTFFYSTKGQRYDIPYGKILKALPS
jgi:predicted nuclease of restriction endonuclease-like RecB superfamily